MSNMYLVGPFANYSVKPSSDYSDAIKKKITKVVISNGYVYVLTGTKKLTASQIKSIKRLHGRNKQPDA